MFCKENQSPYDFTNQPLIGWEEEIDVLAQRNVNIKAPTTIFKKYQHKSRNKIARKSQKNQIIVGTKFPLGERAQYKSNIDLLKFQVDHLENQNICKVRFPTYQTLIKSKSIPSKRKKASMISIDLQSEIKRIKNQSNPSIHKKTNISLSVEGKSQNPSQNTTLSQFNKISKDQFSRETSNQRSRIYRPQTCISHEETNVLESSQIRQSWQTIHCKKDNKVPFKKFFQNKRTSTKTNKYKSSISINQIQGTKLNKLLSALDKN